MEQKHFFHMYANGDEAKNFIVCESDYIAEFNLIAVCAFNTGVTIAAFSIEDTHPHFLLYGTAEQCESFRKMYVLSSKQHILSTRKTLDGVVLDCNLDMITDENHLMSVGTYVINQATKDGKAIMPYDYKWGTGSMYFRSKTALPIWVVNDDFSLAEPSRIDSFSFAEQLTIRCSRSKIPGDWLVCNGLILPSNYVDVELFESIYRTHNCFRAFLSSGKNKDQNILERMAASKGVFMEDLEARKIAEKVCFELFGKRTARWLDVNQRTFFARELRSRFKLAYRQLATLARLPESEIRKYVK